LEEYNKFNVKETIYYLELGLNIDNQSLTNMITHSIALNHQIISYIKNKKTSGLSSALHYLKDLNKLMDLWLKEDLKGIHIYSLKHKMRLKNHNNKTLRKTNWNKVSVSCSKDSSWVRINPNS
jgi:hypothetical protein